MLESVRLLVWDLDETFWKGTVTEGGIEQYIQQNHEIVIELAKRGIMSSICSKNDMAQIKEILEQYNIFEYFIFPSISWEPKGVRLANLIEAVQLRAPTVMFIDDNPNNRAEAAIMVPGIQVEDENFIPFILSDPRFQGKDDSRLSRLKQYKLLEARKRDEEQADDNNEAFLLSCD
jgi:FkbH-like protein